VSDNVPRSSPFLLHGRVAVVTGGNGGLGLAMARALGAAGATVTVTGRNPGKNTAVATEFDARPLDVTDAHAVTALFDAVVADHGRIDILVNNAGVYMDGPALSEDVTAWHRMVDVNLTGPFRCSRAAARPMSRQRRGKIINVGSAYSTFGHPLSAGYGASKAGLVGLTRSLAAELGPVGIQANVILPGWFPTAINGDLPGHPRGEQIRRRTPAGRWGTDDDVAGAVVFLASRASDFVSGAALTIDGGYTVSDRYLHPAHGEPDL
jgi:2-dehydro-3-deoxy-D-gluconate 5-dehydrogenase